jgi:hypothetical protein
MADPGTPTRQGVASSVVFAAAIFSSAFLLFLVQPIIAKYILPWFGGSPAVWTTCLMFFQVMLLAGYAYAHLSIRLLRPRMQAFVHIALLLVAVAVLPINPAERWKPPAGAEPTWRIVSLLIVCLGVPYFALSATGPLLQAWISRLRGGVAPYRLYALSNLGSLLALAAYPFAIEPQWTRFQQARSWSWALAGFAVLCAVCATLVWIRSAATEELPTADLADDCRPPGPFTWLLWLLLPACASALLLATNNIICREISPVPFLWVLPLALYLVSFIICFDSPRWYLRWVFVPALGLAALGLIWVQQSKPSGTSLFRQVAVYCAVLFTCCMVCHGELVRLKPPARSLTAFYLAVAAGGAMGGIFVAVVAPLIFSGYWEFCLGIAACFALVLGTTAMGRGSLLRGWWGRSIWLLQAGGAITLLVFIIGHTFARDKDEFTVARLRDFYGVYSVTQSTDVDWPIRSLYNGGVLHGRQLLDKDSRRKPVTYYGPKSGLGRAIDQLPTSRPWRIGAVGLGTGTVAAYGREGDSVRFYEIDHNVEDIARQYFSYLGDCPGTVAVVIGDARLSMEAEKIAEDSQQFDVLALDAFSGDAIPIHLLTKEAFEVYLYHLDPDGILAVHISNRHLDLYPPVRLLAAEFDLNYYWVSDDGEGWETRSDWVLLSKRQLDIERIEPAPNLRVWTDEDTSLLPILK